MPAKKRPPTTPPEPTHFLNVDLDIEGRAAPLAILIDELGRRLLSLHVGISRGRLLAHYEGRGQSATPEATLRVLLNALERLSPAAKKAWHAARVRDLNIGVQAGRLPHACEYAVTAATLARMVALDARLVVTVYAPFPRPRSLTP